MTRNAQYFAGDKAAGTYLGARGFSDDGSKSGGILAPKPVEVPAGSIVFRFYHDPARIYGAWWATPAELARVYAHFGRSGAAAAEGRASGKGILHATFAVRHDWGGRSPDHLGRFVCAATNVALTAFHGIGDDAPSGDQHSIQKAVRIVGPDGNQRGVRQLYFPNCWTYPDAFTLLENGWTDSGLLSTLRRHRAGPLPFE